MTVTPPVRRYYARVETRPWAELIRMWKATQ